MALLAPRVIWIEKIIKKIKNDDYFLSPLKILASQNTLSIHSNWEILGFRTFSASSMDLGNFRSVSSCSGLFYCIKLDLNILRSSISRLYVIQILWQQPKERRRQL